MTPRQARKIIAADIASKALAKAEEFQVVGWEDYPDIGENDEAGGVMEPLARVAELETALARAARDLVEARTALVTAERHAREFWNEAHRLAVELTEERSLRGAGPARVAPLASFSRHKTW